MDMTPGFPANLLEEIGDHIIVLEVPSLKIGYANRAFLSSYGLTMEAAKNAGRSRTVRYDQLSDGS